jgi:hypothetical protein
MMKGSLKHEKAYRNLFLVAALYDFILGFVFFFFLPFFFEEIYNIAAPIYPAFYQGGAAFVFVMGVGFFFVYLNMYRNVDIVKIGITFKTVYTALAFYYVFIENMPWVFSIFGFLDIIFIILFILFLRDFKREVE